PLGGPLDLVRAERERPARLEVDARAAAPAERPEADLRTLQVLEDRDRPAPARLALADAVHDLRVLLVRAVGKIQARDVEAGRHQAIQLLGAAARGADRADDLGAPHRSGAREERSQELPGIGAFRATGELFGRAGGDHPPALVTA